MNWGYKIMLVYIIFIAGIMFLVFKSSSQKVELVTGNYYEQELKYQQKIDQSERAEALSAPLKYELNGNDLSVVFPSEMIGKKISVHALLYCVADETKDKSYNVTTEDGKLNLAMPENIHGNYELKIDWIAEGISYYSTNKIFIK